MRPASRPRARTEKARARAPASSRRRAHGLTPPPRGRTHTGAISRIYVAFDRETGESRGFAFINFLHRDDAQRAIDKLDGHGYDSLILRVEWAQPRPERNQSQDVRG